MRRLALVLGFTFATSTASAAPVVPDEVKACLAKGVIWLASPQYFERFEIPTPEGSVRPAYQIHDRIEGADGYMLLYADTCRAVVLVQGRGNPSAPMRDVSIHAPPNTMTAEHEVAILFRWMGAQRRNDKLPAHAVAAVLDRLNRRPTDGSQRDAFVVTALPDAGVVSAAPANWPHLVWRPMPGAGQYRVYNLDSFEENHAEGDSGSRVKLFVTKDAPHVAIVGLANSSGGVSWVGAWTLGIDIDARVEAGRLWFIAGDHIVTVDSNNGRTHTLTPLATERQRFGINPKGIVVGAIQAPGRLFAWTDLVGMLQ